MSESTECPAAIDAEGIQAILSGERSVCLETQPIVDLRRGIITGYEALARFDLDESAPPDWVFACANRAGLGIELESLVVQRALALARDTPPNCFLSINVDPQHLTAAAVFEPIIAHGPLDGILFELTEQRRIRDMPAVASCLSELRKRGAYVAVDDAGAGYSGLQQILALRPQFLKADRALVSEVHADEAKRAMLQLLGELAGRLDAWIIAEGIETHAELLAVAQLGVPLGQGYFLGEACEPWAKLPTELEQALEQLPRAVLSSGIVRDIVEPCASCELFMNWPQGNGTCVLLEATGRPAGLRIADDDGVRIRASHELLRVKPSASLASVALRSTARPERLRWDPVVCVDDLGHFAGVIHMHKLVWALACREGAQLSAADGIEPTPDRTAERRR